jgi:hypothetical protein
VSTKKETSAIKLPFDSGEHLVTWTVPDRTGGTLEVPGLLTLEHGKYPTGILYGDMPLEWLSTGESRIASFPQSYPFDSLTGRLSSGAYVSLMNGQLDYWFESQGRATGAFAVLSLDEFEASEHRKYSSIELQLEGLESVAGVTPISQVQMPRKQGDEPRWSATVNQDIKLKWSSGDHSMAFRYDYTVRALDFYEFTMAFGPVLRLEATSPLTIAEWWLEWVRPLRQLVSLLTAAPRELRYILGAVSDEPRAHRDQVFGWDITHVPVNSTRAAVDKIRSAVDLSADGVSLLDLLTTWQSFVAERHPLFETYGAMTTAADQHPRARFLLLLQALEGSYGSEHRAVHDTDKAKYSAKRQSILDRVRLLLDRTDFKFIDKNLRREALQGLDSALAELLKRLPAGVIDELEGTELVTLVRSVHAGPGSLPVHSALTRARNTLSHGSGSFDPSVLSDAADVLERLVRSEAVRLLGAPVAAQERALSKRDR